MTSKKKKKHDVLPRMDEIEGCFLCDCMHNGVSFVFFFLYFCSSCREQSSAAHPGKYNVQSECLEGEFQIGHLSFSQVSTASLRSGAALTTKQWKKKIRLTLNWLSLEWNQWCRCVHRIQLVNSVARTTARQPKLTSLSLCCTCTPTIDYWIDYKHHIERNLWRLIGFPPSDIHSIAMHRHLTAFICKDEQTNRIEEMNSLWTINENVTCLLHFI